MNTVVKFITDDDGEECQPVWHVIDPYNTDPALLCTGEYFGLGQSDVTYIQKEVKRGGVTCSCCLRKLKWAKQYKL